MAVCSLCGQNKKHTSYQKGMYICTWCSAQHMVEISEAFSPKRKLAGRFWISKLSGSSLDLQNIKINRVAASNLPPQEKAIKIVNIVVDGAKSAADYLRSVEILNNNSEDINGDM